jgi:phage shock protein E
MKAFVHAFAVSLLALSVAVAADTAPLIAPDKLVERIEKQDANVLILDVRTPEEFAAGHVPGAKNIPHDQLPSRLAELAGAKDKDIVVYCRSGRRSEMAIDTLSSQGFERLLHLEGDMIRWEREQRPLEK